MKCSLEILSLIAPEVKSKTGNLRADLSASEGKQEKLPFLKGLLLHGV